MNRTVLVPAACFIPKGSTKPLEAENYQWSADGNCLLLFTNSKKVWRQQTRGDSWVLDQDAAAVDQVPCSDMLRFETEPAGRRTVNLQPL